MLDYTEVPIGPKSEPGYYGLQVADPDGNEGTLVATYITLSGNRHIRMAIVYYDEEIEWAASNFLDWPQEDLEVSLSL